MNLFDVVREVRRLLEETGRVSQRMVRRQFDLDDDTLADVIEELVDEQRARALADEAIETAASRQLLVFEVRAQLALARVLRALGGPDASADSAAALDRAQALVQMPGARSYEPQISVERARLAALRSDASGAQQWLREAHRLFTEMGATGYAERLAQELGS